MGWLLLGALATGCGAAPEATAQQEQTGLRQPTATAAALVETASFDAVLQVPTCAAGASGCDTGPSLVLGRGQLGAEPNAPNTLGGTCADGDSGLFHGDESLDRLKVSTPDDSALAPGKEVTIEATVWAWSGYTADHLDLYLAADASNPSWTYVTTLTPAGAGVQVLTANATLPSEGGSVQAVRAVFRYGGEANPCSSGGYDDRDDLAFGVGTSEPPPPPPPPAPVRPSLVAGGTETSVNLAADGTVWSWGGKSGSYTTDYSAYRAQGRQVWELSDAVSVVSGTGHKLALKTDATVWAWGSNTDGELGNGTTFNASDTPEQVVGLDSVIALAGGNHYSLAVRGDGTVWSWGRNQYGQLGDGTTLGRTLPAQVPGLSNGVQVAAGSHHSLAVDSAGQVWSWGYNSQGELGDGSTTSRFTPVQVPGLTGVVAVAAGVEHSLALKSDGTVWAWGYNSRGQLGDGSTSSRFTPVQVVGLTGVVVAVAAGMEHSLALKSDGTVWAWGDNSYGQLGDGTTSSRFTPVQVPSLSGVVAVAAGTRHSLARDSDGRTWAWGNNELYQLGDGQRMKSATAVPVVNLSNVTQVSAGYWHGLAVRSDGTLWSWGAGTLNSYVLGRARTQQHAPALVTGLANVTAAAAGQKHSLALKSDGSVWSWGSNSYGQIGVGPSGFIYDNPVQVTTLSGVSAIATGDSHSLAVKSDGTLWTWGFNDFGQLGDGTMTGRSLPVQVAGLTGVRAAAGGSRHTLVLHTNGTVSAIGHNNIGQLGDGTTTVRRLTPVPVVGLTGVVAVAAGEDHSLALKSDGTVWAWGYNGSGRLGDGTTTSRNTPVQVVGLTGVVAVAAGYSHSLAVKSDGTVWAWGEGYDGQLGGGDLFSVSYNNPTPKKVLGLSGGRSVAASKAYSLALTQSTGTLSSFGLNWEGQLGDGSYLFRTTPALVVGAGAP
ncbi:RCC1-like domain-containing protein [Hyalangium minutum]|nr:RCC1 domain-containing protein [Hyalangium minutum]